VQVDHFSVANALNLNIKKNLNEIQKDINC